jgi:hypothetical protein
MLQVIDIIDSHFHLDLIIQRERLRGFQHLQSIAAPNCSATLIYGVCTIPISPTPTHFDSTRRLPSWSNWERVTPWAATCGCIPKVTSSCFDPSMCSLHLFQLARLGLTIPPVAGAIQCAKMRMNVEGGWPRNQEKALTGMLFLFRDRNMPVVLHCRDNGTWAATCGCIPKVTSSCFDPSMCSLHLFQLLGNT